MDERRAVALNTSLAAGQVLSLGAQKLSASLDSFSGWLLAGFGAVFGLLIANLSTVSAHLSLLNLKVGAVLFLIAAGFAAIQKLFAAYVSAGAAAGEEGRKYGKELAAGSIPLDVESMYLQVRQGLFWPLSAFNARVTAQANSGDYAGPGRHQAYMSQFQLLAVVLQAIFSIAAGAYVVAGIAI